MQRTKKSIIEKSIKLFNKNGFQTPVKDIIAAANISNGSFFHYFPKKDCLPHEIFTYIKQDLSNILLIDDLENLEIREKSKIIFNTIIDWGVKNSEYFLFLLKFKNSHYKTEEENILRLYIYFLIEEGINLKVFKDANIMFMADIAISIMAHTIFKIKEKDADKNEIKELSFDIFYDSISL